MTNADLVARYDGRLPRYTSYPTAPHFNAAIDSAAYAAWLGALPDGAELSLYLHVPFCERLCHYCGCNSGVVRREGPRRGYAALLEQEVRLVAGAIGRRAAVTHVHWGGGTPTTLPGDCLTSLNDLIGSLFDVRPGAEIAIEIDPTTLPPDRLAALSSMLVTRVSLGVQDFEPAVQQAIGRVQSFAQTAECAASVRGIGVTSLNLDLIYGLPFQTVETVVRTARQALALSPDRVAVFGYAHVPWLKRHQALISEDSLPGPLARFAQCRAIGEVMLAAGYVAVGLDHFAKPSDRLAQAAGDESLRRNFQGYTTDGAPVLIGIGASAIGSLPGGYAQNEAGVPAFAAAIGAGRLATARGIALTPDDALRRVVIERIMCGALADLPSIAQTHQLPDSGLLADAAALDQCAADGLVEWDGRRVRLTEAGRPFARNVASIFDRYLVASEKRHAQSV